MFLSKLVKQVSNNLMNKREGFQEDGSQPGIFIASSLIAFIITQLLLVFIGKYIWNTYLVNSVTFAKPLQSGFQLFALSMLIQLLSI